MKILLRLTTISFIAVLPISSWGICIKNNRANIRSGPGTSYQIVWEVYQHMPFRKMGRKGKWIKVKDFEGEVNWVHSKLVTSAYMCAVVKAETANRRSGPGTRYRKLGSAAKYYSFKVIKKTGKWVKLKDDYGEVFWIYRPLLWVN